MTGTIVRLTEGTRTGTIRSEDGGLLVFSAAGVLGDYDTLAVGHLVRFDPDRSLSPHTAVCVFHEPLGASGPVKKPDAAPDLRYAGFTQAGNIRNYCFDSVARGGPAQHFVVAVDLALMLKHHIGVQEGPALCLRKLATDLKTLPDAGRHELVDEDLRAYASARAAAAEKKGHKHHFANRGSSPPALSNHIQAT